MIQIIPSVLATSEEQYKNDIIKFEKSYSLDGGWVHIDFADNIFVRNKTIDVDDVTKFPTNFRKEAHLMVLNPRDWIDSLAKAMFERIIIHIEAESVDETIKYIKGKGLSVGLSLKNGTDIGKLEPFIGRIDTILIMSIDPGFQGQPFLPLTFEKIESIKSKGWNVRIGVDGAVKNDNIKEIVSKGVDFVVVGSYLLEGDVDENLEKLWEVINV